MKKGYCLGSYRLICLGSFWDRTRSFGVMAPFSFWDRFGPFRNQGDPVDQSVLDTRALQVFQHHLWQVPQIFGAVRSVGKTAKVAVGSR